MGQGPAKYLYASVKGDNLQLLDCSGRTFRIQGISGELQKGITDTLEKHGEINLAIVFGSLVHGNERFESDIDIAVVATMPLSTDKKRH